eukprot:UN05178
MKMDETNYNINVCQHDVNVKLSGAANFDYYRMDGVEIYKWFESRKCKMPPHYNQYM